jgi:molecular chaperone DnaJ
MFGETQTQSKTAEQSFQEAGSDIRYNLDLTLEEAFRGTAAQMRFKAQSKCESCKGSGSEAGAVASHCSTCQGRGKVRYQQGFFTIERTCHVCYGAGKTIKNPCSSCKGTGRLKKERNLEVKIPAGVEEGTRIRVTAEGESGIHGGQPGDLYVFISLKPHSLFKRTGSDLHCRVPISFITAALGGEIEVPLIDGFETKVRIPAGTQNQQQFRLKNKGMSILKSKSRGDMIIEAFVETPVNLTKKQKELLKTFEEEGKNELSNHPELTGFFKKAKDFFGT